jgi:hypothetical protein
LARENGQEKTVGKEKGRERNGGRETRKGKKVWRDRNNGKNLAGEIGREKKSEKFWREIGREKEK